MSEQIMWALNSSWRLAKRPDELSTVDSADKFRARHGIEIVEPLKVASRGKGWMEAWDRIWHYTV